MHGLKQSNKDHVSLILCDIEFFWKGILLKDAPLHHREQQGEGSPDFLAQKHILPGNTSDILETSDISDTSDILDILDTSDTFTTTVTFTTFVTNHTLDVPGKHHVFADAR